MTALSTDVLVIGGGATGAGVAWDAALRGYDVVLVDRADLAEGTSGRFHGLLHSGGRYAVKDPHAAEECIGENRDPAEDRRRLHRGHRRASSSPRPSTTRRTATRSSKGCRDTGIDCEEIDPAEALSEEPRLNPTISRVFRVPDGNIDVWKTVWALAHGAQEHGGARCCPTTRSSRIHRDGERVTGARLRDELPPARSSTSRRV